MSQSISLLLMYVLQGLSYLVTPYLANKSSTTCWAIGKTMLLIVLMLLRFSLLELNEIVVIQYSCTGTFLLSDYFHLAHCCEL